jgi:hypothetical protein
VKSGELELSLDVKSIARLNIKTVKTNSMTRRGRKHFFAQHRTSQDNCCHGRMKHTERERPRKRESQKEGAKWREKEKRGKERASEIRRCREKKGNFFYLER